MGRGLDNRAGVPGWRATEAAAASCSSKAPGSTAGSRRTLLSAAHAGPPVSPVLPVRQSGRRPGSHSAHLAVEAVGHAAVPRDGIPKVLDLETALKPGGKEAAKRRQEGGKQGQGHLRGGLRECVRGGGRRRREDTPRRSRQLVTAVGPSRAQRVQRGLACRADGPPFSATPRGYCLQSQTARRGQNAARAAPWSASRGGPSGPSVPPHRVQLHGQACEGEATDGVAHLLRQQAAHRVDHLSEGGVGVVLRLGAGRRGGTVGDTARRHTSWPRANTCRPDQQPGGTGMRVRAGGRNAAGVHGAATWGMLSWWDHVGGRPFGVAVTAEYPGMCSPLGLIGSAGSGQCRQMAAWAMGEQRRREWTGSADDWQRGRQRPARTIRSFRRKVCGRNVSGTSAQGMGCQMDRSCSRGAVHSMLGGGTPHGQTEGAAASGPAASSCDIPCQAQLGRPSGRLCATTQAHGCMLLWVCWH